MDNQMTELVREQVRDKGRWERFRESDFYYNFKRSPVAVVSFAVVCLLVLSAVFAPLIAPTNPFDPGSLNLMNGFTAPMEPNAFTGESFLLGTDDQGRDVFSTILYGMRISLFVGAAAVAFAMVLGITLGLISVMFVGINLIVDILYVFIDPRLAVDRAGGH